MSLDSLALGDGSEVQPHHRHLFPINHCFFVFFGLNCSAVGADISLSLATELSSVVHSMQSTIEK